MKYIYLVMLLDGCCLLNEDQSTIGFNIGVSELTCLSVQLSTVLSGLRLALVDYLGKFF